MVASLLRVLHSGPQDQRLMPKEVKESLKAYVRVIVRAGRMTTQWQRIDFLQQPGLGQQAVARIPVKGELLTRLYLVATMPDIETPQAAAKAAAGSLEVQPQFGWTNSLGHALVESATLEIGGARVEQLDSRLLEILDEFNTPLEKVLGVNDLIQRKQNGFSPSSIGRDATPTRVVVPLPFWFSRGDIGAALPIDALYVDEVRVSLQLRALSGLYYTDSRSDSTDTANGAALWPILNSPFYTLDGSTYVYNLLPKVSDPILADLIPGIKMPSTLPLGDTYLLAEYVYLDKPEANRFRIADISLPVIQHAPINPVDTRGFPRIQVPVEINNPLRTLYWMAQNYSANRYNAYFLATRDLSGLDTTDVPWWPDCVGLSVSGPGTLIPGFARRDSEPFSFLEVLYEGSYVRTSTENCALYRSLLPSYEMKKSPWHNRYMYALSFGQQPGLFPGSAPIGEANWNRILKKELVLGCAPLAGTFDQYARLWIYVWAETYNVFRVYGGRGAMLFT